jgi:hypothetical protein
VILRVEVEDLIGFETDVSLDDIAEYLSAEYFDSIGYVAD